MAADRTTNGEGSCVFCSIVSGEVAADEVYRDDSVVAFLDHSPLFVGHTLVVPHDHHVTLADLPSSELTHFFEVVQALSGVMPVALGSQGTFVAMNNIVSQSVPHLHAHVVPRSRRDGLKGFFWPRTKYGSTEEAAEVSAKIGTELMAVLDGS